MNPLNELDFNCEDRKGRKNNFERLHSLIKDEKDAENALIIWKEVCSNK